MSQPIYVQILA